MSRVGALGKGNLLVSEAVEKRAAELRTGPEGDSPTAIEKLLAVAVVAMWPELSHAQVALNDTRADETARSATSVKRADSALKRHLAARKS